ncbi:hypothetical protein ACFWUQ_23635 [Streptomyces sp. NPDC058662]|uniref:hypothetical protein n=1 Tax=Streptomyces sp. NPDC058662 TaxID=3346583 RepID=UPI00365217B3
MLPLWRRTVRVDSPLGVEYGAEIQLLVSDAGSCGAWMTLVAKAGPESWAGRSHGRGPGRAGA